MKKELNPFSCNQQELVAGPIIFNGTETQELDKFMFPVTTEQVYVEDALTTKYKAVVREDNNNLISIMKKSYQVVPNADVIKPLMEQLVNFDTRWYLDSSHSFVEDNRMRLQVTFPELFLNDGKSDIALSLFLHNSYDGSEGVRMFWGAIRFICSNGMVFGKVLSKFYGKHTKNISLGNLKEQLEKTYTMVPAIQQRIDELQDMIVTEELMKELAVKFGAGLMEFIKSQERALNQWVLYNYITYFVSHTVQQKMRAQYQMKASKLFKL